MGETIHYQSIVHYVAPPAEEVPEMLEGLQVFLERTKGQSPFMRSRVAASAVITDDIGERKLPYNPLQAIIVAARLFLFAPSALLPASCF